MKVGLRARGAEGVKAGVGVRAGLRAEAREVMRAKVGAAMPADMLMNLMKSSERAC